MRKIYTFLLTIFVGISYAQVLVEDDTSTSGVIDPSAALEVRSTNKGFLVPRMNDAPANPVAGLIYYDADGKCFKSYKENTWFTMGDNACFPAPVASNVAISGDVNVGSLVTGTYDYFDQDGDEESGSVYQWQYVSRGRARNISGATNIDYNISPSYEGRDIRFCVTPSDGTYLGTKVCSNWVTVGPFIPPVNRINEINYDPSGQDMGEFVEIRVEFEKDISNMSVVLYNGNDAKVYDTTALTASNVTATTDATNTYTYYVIDYPSNGIQNGVDAIALVDGTDVIEFLSYEGTFTAADGPANGKESLDIGAAQLNQAETVQRSDDGLTWATSPDTEGAVNVYVQPQTKVRFNRFSQTVFEGDGTATLTVNIQDPDPANATTVDVVLVSGDAADLNNYTTQTLTFAAGDATPKVITLTISDDPDTVSEDYSFQLQNVAGGNNAVASAPTSTLLTVQDDDAIPSTIPLVITGVIDGPLSGGVPKAVELYVLEDITDLAIYGLGSATNGGGTDGVEFNFPTGTSATAGTYIYVASESSGFNSFFGFAPDYTAGAIAVNGDDAIELFQGNTAVDVFGDINTDGSGTSWEYKDGWAYSNNARVPSTTFSDTDWSYSGVNALNGATTNASATTPFPIGTYQP